MRSLRALKAGFKTRRRWVKRKLHTFPLWYQERDYIFIHINKTGGSSVEKALNLPFEHLTAREKIAEVGLETWRDKFTFAFVRNPFDKVCSHYRYRVRTNQTNLKKKPLSFTQWVKVSYGDKDPYYMDNPKMFMPQVDWLSDEQGQLAVDKIYRFEQLAKDFNTFCQHFQLNVSLPHIKASKKVRYQAYYDEQTRHIIAQHFAKDLEAFGYQFQGDY